jgi:DNA-binding response OmpR family regulator
MPRFKILAIENDLTTRAALFSLLEDDAFDVTLSRTAEGGLEHLRTRSFDLVLTDYRLPRNSGTWMLAQAREGGVDHGSPALVVTADPDLHSNELFTVIRKPLDGQGLLRTIRKLVTAPSAA